MTMIVFDFADIRSRMLWDDKPKPKKVEIDPVLRALCEYRDAKSFGVDLVRPCSDRTIHTRIYKDEWHICLRRNSAHEHLQRKRKSNDQLPRQTR